MNPRHNTVLVSAVISMAIVSGCVTERKSSVAHQVGESVVFIGEEPAALAYLPLPGHRLSVRNTYLPGPDTVDYLEGRDFVVNYSAGTLRRTPASRLPDFRANLLFGQREFDHTKFPGFGNTGFFAFVDYAFAPTTPWPVQAPQTQFLRATKAKLDAGQSVRIVAFGDSITAGGDATRPELIFWQRWAADLQKKYPRARVTALNGATGGDSTVQGLRRLQAKVLDQKPDLVLIGFGMNDHNRSGVPVPQFETNLKQMITRIRDETAADIILFSAFPPNPHWKFGSHRMAAYAAGTARVARETGCAYADVFNNWESIAAWKKPEDLLGNNINHPNDFGHWIYFRVLQQLGL
jgi:lysophospholipase L1-like esterase